MLVPQLCPTLCNPADCSLPASSVHGILQVRILNCVAIPSLVAFPNSGVEPRGFTPLSHQGSPLCIIGIIFTHQDTIGDSWKTWRSLPRLLESWKTSGRSLASGAQEPGVILVRVWLGAWFAVKEERTQHWKALWDHRHFFKVGRCSSSPLHCLPCST